MPTPSRDQPEATRARIVHRRHVPHFARNQSRIVAAGGESPAARPRLADAKVEPTAELRPVWKRQRPNADEETDQAAARGSAFFAASAAPSGRDEKLEVVGAAGKAHSLFSFRELGLSCSGTSAPSTGRSQSLPQDRFQLRGPISQELGAAAPKSESTDRNLVRGRGVEVGLLLYVDSAQAQRQRTCTRFESYLPPPERRACLLFALLPVWPVLGSGAKRSARLGFPAFMRTHCPTIGTIQDNL